MISALDEIDSIVRCIEAGAEDYIPKPFDPVLLGARIEASLERKRLRDRELAFTDELRVEKGKTEALLLNILPGTIVSRIRKGETLRLPTVFPMQPFYLPIWSILPTLPADTRRRGSLNCSTACSQLLISWPSDLSWKRSRRSAMPTWQPADCQKKVPVTRLQLRIWRLA